MFIGVPRSLLPVAAVTLILVPAPALAAADEDAQLWTTTTVSAPLSDAFTLSGGVYVRASDMREGIYQLHLLGDLDYDAGDGFTLTLGYSHIPSYEGGAHVTTENRVRQQVSFPLARVGSGKLSGRLRLEQRWRDDGEDLKFRLRPAVTFALPIGPDELSLRLGHESFFNLNETDWGPDAGYDRMRNQASVRRSLGGGFTGEVGYLNQYIFGRDDPDEVDHVLTVGLNYDF